MPERTNDDGAAVDPDASDAGVWATPLDRRRRRRWRTVGTVAGLVLLMAALAVLLLRGQELPLALEALRSPSPTALLALAGSLLGSTLLSTIVLKVLIERHGRVGWREMFELVCSSTLGNFIPLQPGLAGRVAYHHLVNRIPVQRTVLSLLEATLASAVSVGLLLAALWAHSRFGAQLPWWSPALAGLVALPLLPSPRLRPFAWALAARWLELLLWGVRAWACFALVGETISPHAALAFGCVAVGANLVPFIGNGLGIREWAVGLLATPLAGIPLSAGLAAELVGRAAELLFFVPAGLWAGRCVVSRLRRVLESATPHGPSRT